MPDPPKDVAKLDMQRIHVVGSREHGDAQHQGGKREPIPYVRKQPSSERGPGLDSKGVSSLKHMHTV